MKSKPTFAKDAIIEARKLKQQYEDDKKLQEQQSIVALKEKIDDRKNLCKTLQLTFKEFDGESIDSKKITYSALPLADYPDNLDVVKLTIGESSYVTIGYRDYLVKEEYVPDYGCSVGGYTYTQLFAHFHLRDHRINYELAACNTEPEATNWLKEVCKEISYDIIGIKS